MNVAGKDYCNRFDIKKSEFFVWRTLKIDTMSWISVSKKADTDKNFSPTVSQMFEPDTFSPPVRLRLLGALCSDQDSGNGDTHQVIFGK